MANANIAEQAVLEKRMAGDVAKGSRSGQLQASLGEAVRMLAQASLDKSTDAALVKGKKASGKVWERATSKAWDELRAALTTSTGEGPPETQKRDQEAALAAYQRLAKGDPGRKILKGKAAASKSPMFKQGMEVIEQRLASLMGQRFAEPPGNDDFRNDDDVGDFR